MIKFLRQKYYLLPFLILFLVPVIYSLFRIGSQNYWDGALGNWLATMLGVIGGIPIALEINRFVTELDDLKKKKAQLLEVYSVLELELVLVQLLVMVLVQPLELVLVRLVALPLVVL